MKNIKNPCPEPIVSPVINGTDIELYGGTIYEYEYGDAGGFQHFGSGTMTIGAIKKGQDGFVTVSFPEIISPHRFQTKVKIRLENSKESHGHAKARSSGVQIHATVGEMRHVPSEHFRTARLEPDAIKFISKSPLAL